MAKIKDNKKNNKDTKYNADNEIIIGVTTKPKEKVRVEKKKATRTNIKSSKNKNSTSRSNVNRNIPNKNIKPNSKLKVNKSDLSKENQIKKLNKKKIAISVVIVLFIVICGTIYYLTTPIFNITSIKVYGNQKNNIDTYISLSGLKINETNIFAFTNGSIKKKIKENAYVEEVKIERIFPNVVELYITERTVDYKINYLNSYVYLNSQGYILEISEDEKDALIIEGINFYSNDIKMGKRLPNEELIKLDTVLKITNYLKYNSVNKKLTKVNVADEENYILEFAEENKYAYIGDSSSITEKMTAIAKILEVEEGKKGKIYANEEVLKKNRVYFSEDVED